MPLQYVLVAMLNLNLNLNLYFLLLQLYTKHAINLIKMLKPIIIISIIPSHVGVLEC